MTDLTYEPTLPIRPWGYRDDFTLQELGGDPETLTTTLEGDR